MDNVKDVSAGIKATIANLKDAIVGETTASTKYAAYAGKAREEGYNKIALLFEAASKSEAIHAANHVAALEELGMEMDKFTPNYEVKSTKENVQDAIDGESYEVSTMYPDFLKTAKEENVEIAIISFTYAFQTEKKHKKLFQNAMDQLNAGKEDTLAAMYYVCTTCGNTYETKAPDRCGICMTSRERFIVFK